MNIKWEGRNGSYDCPSKVLCFLDLRNLNITHTERGDYLKNSLYAIVHSTETFGVNNKPSSHARKGHRERGGSSIITFWSMEKNYWMIPVSSFNSLCFIIANYRDKDMSSETGYVMEIKSKLDWAICHM